MKQLKIFLFTVMIVTLMGCVSPIALSPQDRKSLSSIKIDPVVDMPNGMAFNADGASVGRAFGLVGNLVADDIVNRDTREIMLIQKRLNFSVDKILVANLVNAINRSGKTKVVNDPANAVMTLQVYTYGFTAPALGFSPKLAPQLGVTAELVRDGRVIWRASSNIDPVTDNLPAYTMNEIIANPILLRKLWEAAADLAAAQLVKKL